ncbi:hypothetical protein HU200_034075 [Digitaria exilis]|uniref:Uncharacterized protein n=1 Tax=Digitaria exilis TaxID=1010633 RepID=A0A835BKF5_9POAL|nr:hypothetical protein HU200_034075 [Digitaria exilis]
MKTEGPRAATQAMRCIVVVSDNEFDEDYCSGFVAVKIRVAAESTQRTEDMERYQRLVVSFFDGVQSHASVEAEEEGFCLLSTPYHSSCEAITWMTDDTRSRLPPCSTFMLAPVSSINTHYLPTYTNVESTEAYLEDYNRVMVDSDNYFLVSCDFFEKTLSGLCRLVGGPLFIMHNEKRKETGEAMGIVLQNCQPGSEIRIAIGSTHFKKIMNKLDPAAPPPGGGREKMKRKRKRKAAL